MTGIKLAPDIIALHGLKGAGKDTVAQMIMKYRPQMKTWAFAHKLKEVCALAFHVPLRHFYDEELKEQCLDFTVPGYRHQYVTPRLLMKDMADTLKAKFGADFFAVDLAWAATSKDYAGGMIVTDLRAYDGEERVMVDRVGARVIHILRPVNDVYAAGDAHGSEKALPVRDGDIIIVNEGTKRDLLLKVRGAIQVIFGQDALKAYPYVPDDPEI